MQLQIFMQESSSLSLCDVTIDLPNRSTISDTEARAVADAIITTPVHPSFQPDTLVRVETTDPRVIYPLPPEE